MKIDSFDAARAAAAAAGIQVVAWGSEDETHFLTYPDPAGGDGLRVVSTPEWELIPAKAVMVEKATGLVTRASVVPEVAFRNWVPVGEWPVELAADL